MLLFKEIVCQVEQTRSRSHQSSSSAVPQTASSSPQDLQISPSEDQGWAIFTYFTKFVYISTQYHVCLSFDQQQSQRSHLIFHHYVFFFFRSMCLLMLRVNSAKRCRIRFRKLLTVRNVLPFPARSRRF